MEGLTSAQLKKKTLQLQILVGTIMYPSFIVALDGIALVLQLAYLPPGNLQRFVSDLWSRVLTGSSDGTFLPEFPINYKWGTFNCYV